MILVQPEIPHNSGAVARLAAATATRLHLVEPLGYSLEDRYLKRAGLDYWPLVDLCVHRDWEAALAAITPGSSRPIEQRLWLFSARGGRSLFELPFESDDVLVFGRESRGLPPELLLRHAARQAYIPIHPQVRSLNLSSAAAIALYTALSRSGQGLPDNDGRYQAHPRAGEHLRPAQMVRRGDAPSD